MITPNSPLPQNITQKFYLNDPNAYYALGMPLVSGGLVNVVQVNGIGLVTNGFVWQIPELWFAPQSVDGIATGWTAALGYAGSTSVITTSWTDVSPFWG